MKKMILLAVAFVSFAALTSCSNEDENASLLGKWEYFFNSNSFKMFSYDFI